MKRLGIFLGIFAFALFLFSACNEDYIELKPLSSITPQDFFNDESQLASYSLNLYTDNLFRPGYGNYFYASDRNTDSQITRDFSDAYAVGQYKVPQGNGSWEFRGGGFWINNTRYDGGIRGINYFLQQVLPKYRAGKITGDTEMVKHDIGEAYFFRALAYFGKLVLLGDFPIVKTVLTADMQILTDASKRAPRNEVARFIISDLDSAIILLKQSSPDGNKNRLSKNVAQLLKSRVALYEATWLKYFKETAFVPNGPSWPGSGKDYNMSYVFPSGSIDGEISYFLDQAIASSKVVADAVPLVTNTFKIQQDPNEPANPYFDMFSGEDLSGYSEILLWKQYNRGLNITNNSSVEATGVNNYWGSPTGYTRGMVETFLMANGLPIYAPGSGYKGDDSTQLVVIGRDDRLHQFLHIPGQKNVLYPATDGTVAPFKVQPYPQLTPPIVPNVSYIITFTGYMSRKGLNYREINQNNTVGGSNGLPLFRAVEAYLNYIEASYEKNGSLDADATNYWKQIRDRAGVDNDFYKTIAATDMSKEALNDWAAYSGGQLVSATLYNIRRERRCELLGEGSIIYNSDGNQVIGFRQMDLNRWRAKDQLIQNPYHPEGFKIWGPMKKWVEGISDLKYDQGDISTVSSPNTSIYLRPYEKSPNHMLAGGMTWKMAHYLEPIAVEHFMVTSQNNDLSTSPIYQNPGWSTIVDQPASN